jgi:hypothetical protein
MAQVARLKLRLFLEGQEVPVIAAAIGMTVGSTSTASIQIIPTSSSILFKPRTTVHLYFYDYIDEIAMVESAVPSREVSGLEAARRSDSSATGDEDDDRHYKQLFAGDLIGYSFTKDSMNRSCVLQCVDHTNIWDYTYQYAINFQNDNANLTGTLAQAGGQQVNILSDVIPPTLEVVNIVKDGAELDDVPLSFPGLGGLMGGIINLLEQIGGVFVGGVVPDSVRSISPFYFGYEARNRVMDQIFVEANDTTSAKLFETAALSNMIANNFGQGGLTRLSVRSMLDILLSYVYHSYVVITTPKYDPTGKTATATIAGARVAVRNAIRIRQIAELDKSISRAKKELNPDSLPEGTISEVLTDPESDLFLKTLRTVPTSLEALKVIRQDLFILSQTKGSKGNTDSSRQDRLNSVVFRPDLYFLPPPRCNVLFPEMYDQYSFSRDMLAEPTRLFVDTSHILIDGGRPTLLEMKLRILAPDIPQISGVADPDDLNDRLLGMSQIQGASKQQILLMPHETFSGIILERETLPDIFVYTERTLAAARDPSRSSESTSETVGTSLLEDVPYLRDAANFEFFKLKFSSRAMSVQGRFNPYLAPGFSALVIDKLEPTHSDDTTFGQAASSRTKTKFDGGIVTIDRPNTQAPQRGNHSETLELDARSGFNLGVHFLGLIVRLQHSVSQTGGNTFTDLSHVRPYNEAVDFGGDLDKVSLEDFIFPPWFDDLYRPNNIVHYYHNVLGVGSIIQSTDVPAALKFIGGKATPADSRALEGLTTARSTQKALASEQSSLEAMINEKRAAITGKDADISMSFPVKDKESVRVDKIKKGFEYISKKGTGPFHKHSTLSEIDSYLKAVSEANTKIEVGIRKGTITFIGALGVDQKSSNQFTRFQNNLAFAQRLHKELVVHEKRLEDIKSGKAKAREKTSKALGRLESVELNNNSRVAVEDLVSLYRQVVSVGANVSEFVNKFTYRPIATMKQSLSFFKFAFGNIPIPELTNNEFLNTVDERSMPAAHRRGIANPTDPRAVRQEIVVKYKQEVQRGAAFG